jgi:hypothetical protein
VVLKLPTTSESPGTLEDDVYFLLRPWNVLRCALVEDANGQRAHFDASVANTHRVGRATVHAVVFEEVRERLRVEPVVRSDHHEVRTGPGGPEPGRICESFEGTSHDSTPDSPKSVDSDPKGSHRD